MKRQFEIGWRPRRTAEAEYSATTPTEDWRRRWPGMGWLLTGPGSLSVGFTSYSASVEDSSSKIVPQLERNSCVDRRFGLAAVLRRTSHTTTKKGVTDRTALQQFS